MFRRFCLLSLMLLSLNAIAGPEPTRFGDLVVYHNVFNSSMLQPDIAASAGLMRGPTHGVLNVAVQRPDGSAVDAVLKGEVRSLIGQPVALAFQHLRHRDAGPAFDHRGDLLGAHGLFDHQPAVFALLRFGQLHQCFGGLLDTSNTRAPQSRLVFGGARVLEVWDMILRQQRISS